MTNETHKSYTNADLGRAYRDTRERVTALIRELPDHELKTVVPACPAWSVRDVVGHLAAVAEDMVSRRLTRPPNEAETAAQVERMRDRSVPQLLADWEKAAASSIEAGLVSTIRISVIDVTSHEHDLRSALSRPGARDSEAVRLVSEMLMETLRPPVPLRVVMEDAEFHVGPEAEAGQELVLTTSRFEAVRWRMGRRSAAQLAAMQWSADPAAVLGKLMVFGPAEDDVIE